MAQMIAVHSFRDICISDAVICEESRMSGYLDELILIIILDVDILSLSGIEIERIVFLKARIHYSCRKFKAVFLALGEVFFDTFAVVIDVAPAVIADILVSPFVFELYIRIHLRQLLHYGVGSCPCSKEFQLIFFKYSIRCIAVAIPFRTPVRDSPAIPVIITIYDTFLRTKITAINIIRHRQYLFKIYRAYTIFICFYRLKHSLDTALISGEGYNACYMIRHS